MTPPRFTLRQLEIFAAVVRTGQVRRAAEALYLSQAAVSQAVHELADALDVTLFERQGRERVPTAAARQLLQLASEPMAALEKLGERLAPGDRRAPLYGNIRLAASSTITRYILPSALAAMRRAHPHLEIMIISGNSVRVETCVAQMQADIGFIEGPAQRPDLDVAAWGTDILQIIAPPGYTLDDIQLDALDAHAWVAREPGSGTRAVFEQTLALAGVAPPRASLVIDDSGAIVRAVAAGAGLACVSRLAALRASATAQVQFVDLPDLPLRRPLWRVQRAAASPTPLVERFLETLDSVLRADRAVDPGRRPPGN